MGLGQGFVPLSFPVSHVQEAMTAGDAPTASALRSLLVHAAEASEAVGRLQLAKGQAELARRRFAEAVEQVG